MSSALEFVMNYDSLPLSKRFAIKGTKDLTRNNINDGMGGHEGDDFLALSGLVKGSNYNFVDPNTGLTPLLNASIHGKLAIVRVLIDRGADVEFKERGKLRNALMLAAKNGHDEVVEHLLYRGATVNSKDKYDMTALMLASKGGHYKCMLSLMIRGASLNIGDMNGYTAIHYSSRQGHKEIVEYLVGAGGAVELKDSIPREGKTALHLAAQYGRNETVAILLDNGAKINRRTTDDKFTPLMLAAKEGHKTTVSLLISRGADANLVDLYGWSALHFTASWGRRETAHILLVDGRANLNSRESDLSNANENFFNKKIYNKKNKTPEEMNDGVVGGTTPLVVAVKAQQVEIVKLLLNYGADINLPELKFGNSPVACAAQLGFIDVMKVLVEYNCQLNIRNQLNGSTALMLAAAQGHRGAIMFLLNHFADINIIDNESLTALDYATVNGHKDRFLAVISQIDKYAKVNLIPWIELECPRLDRNLESGGPSVYLNNTLFDLKGIYHGLLSLSSDCDVYLVYCLSMLAAACSRSMKSHRCDSPDLEVKLRQIEDMLIKCISTRYMCHEETFNDVFVLSNQCCTEYLRRGNVKENYDIKFFSSAFFAGPLALYIDCGLSRLLTVPQMAERIDRYMYCCVRDPGADIFGYGVETAVLRSRYCPAVMIVAEGLSKLALLSITISYVDGLRSTSSSGSTTVAAIIAIFTISTWIYEVGNMEEKRWAVSPSIVFDLKALEQRRIRSVYLHFFDDIWKFFDFAVLMLESIWIITYLFGGSAGPLGNLLLATSCIPLSLGLLRYPAVFSTEFGTAVLGAFLAAKSLFHYLIIYAFTGLGFGVTLYSIFRSDLSEFNSPSKALRMMFDAVLVSYDSSLFEGVQNETFGVSISFIFLLWTVVVLFTCIIASVTHKFGSITQQAFGLQALMKCKQIKQFNMTFEKSPLCMLPPPLNLLPTAVYPFHVYYSWRDRFFIDRARSVSVAGTLTDWIIALMTCLPLAVYEYFLFVATADRYFLGKMCLCLCAPAGIIFTVFCLLVKAFSEPIVRRLVRCKMSDGRLRLSHSEERDAFEGSSLSNFEDERIHKSVERYNIRVKEWEQENNRTAQDDFSNDHGASESGSHRSDDEDNRVMMMSSSTNSIVTTPKPLKKKPSIYDSNMQALLSFTKGSVYTGKNVRITPYSPFLQLANIGSVESAHSLLADKMPATKDDSIFLQKSNKRFKDASEINNDAVMSPNGRLSIQSEAKEAHTDNGFAEQPERPDLLMVTTDGKISNYQPGLTTMKELKNFSSTVNEDDFPSVRQQETSKNIYSDDDNVRRILDFPSLYFLPFKFAPIFTIKERKEIFSVVIPEAFIDDFGAAVRDMETYLDSLRSKLSDIDKKQDAHLPAILRKVNESNDW